MNKGLVERAFEIALALLWVAGFVLVLNTFAHAADAPAFPCRPADSIKTIAEHRGEPYSGLTPDQWQFARGLYAMLPPFTGLPPGDSAALVVHADGSGAVIYLDGDQACAPMSLGKEMIDILMQVGRGEIVHPGKSL